MNEHLGPDDGLYAVAEQLERFNDFNDARHQEHVEQIAKYALPKPQSLEVLQLKTEMRDLKDSIAIMIFSCCTGYLIWRLIIK